MLLHPVSDLHNEFQPWRPPGDVEGVLIAAGDIHTSNETGNWLRKVAPLYRHIVAILGNHDYWGVAADEAVSNIRRSVESCPNVHVLDRSSVVLGNTRFVGCTLWTHVPPTAQMQVQRSMQDYKLINTFKNGPLINVAHTNEWHAKDKQFLQETLSTKFDGATVVVTHHAPSYQSIHDCYKDNVKNVALSAAYYTDLDGWAQGLDFDLWVHGHTHHSFEYPFGQGQVVCNPRGYAPAHLNPDFNPHMSIDSELLRQQRKVVAAEELNPYAQWWAQSGV